MAEDPHDLGDVLAALDMDRARAELEALVRIPSISAPGHDPAEVRRSAEATAALLADAGLADVTLLEVDGAPPSVFAQWSGAGTDALTVLLYAHHDVQPVATPHRWTSPPFEPTEREGRLYGRGAADDKAGILVHVAAVRAWLAARGALPVNVKVIVEGEEEIGSPHLAELVSAHADRLRADVIVLTDVANWKVGWPGLTYALRGLADLVVTVRTLRQPVHSGMWGGPVPDALTALARLLASLHDEHGAIAVDGFADDVRAMTVEERARMDDLEADPEALRAEAGMLDSVRWAGDPDTPLLERIWMHPTITPIAIEAPGLDEASNQLVAQARAKLSVRLAPGQDPDRVMTLLSDHLRRHAPFGAEVDVERGVAVPAWSTEPTGPAFAAAARAMEAAYGRPPALLGCGGTIPFVAPFAEAFGGVPCLLTGIEDPATNAHGEDESVHLGDFARACAAEAHLFAELARGE
ncbi:MAG TPA: M20/M25/M40 family metallo-hydrolase [Acidimicrobiia bacterium]|nr:M20/M25/M40 family metallo-hydrolase [Acidimicrobiia bacterium]